MLTTSITFLDMGLPFPDVAMTQLDLQSDLRNSSLVLLVRLGVILLALGVVRGQSEAVMSVKDF